MRHACTPVAVMALLFAILSPVVAAPRSEPDDDYTEHDYMFKVEIEGEITSAHRSLVDDSYAGLPVLQYTKVTFRVDKVGKVFLENPLLGVRPPEAPPEVDRAGMALKRSIRAGVVLRKIRFGGAGAGEDAFIRERVYGLGALRRPIRVKGFLLVCTKFYRATETGRLEQPDDVDHAIYPWEVDEGQTGTSGFLKENLQVYQNDLLLLSGERTSR